MGYNTYNAYGCANNEADLLSAANSIVSLGLKSLGYEYVNSEAFRISFSSIKETKKALNYS